MKPIKVRVRLAELNLHRYILAGAARVSPSALARFLNEKGSLSAESEQRIADALERLGQEAASR